MKPNDETWHKSSYSNAESNCVEMAITTCGGGALRDTQNRGAGFIALPSAEWTAFLRAVKSAEL
ncbi:DUF397 domain-containing protein [Streptomonospora sp. PA3]|uniref:DUF397 domain-containing protein n=1 Tax=Streptomonospora sp. PA3 TaxID=2607326 RepID=UPI001307EA11|nr:DUF397 domain-containing protein [Streptomonospora sp. PA3]